MSITPLGDRALMVRLGTVVDQRTHLRVRAAYARLEAAALPGVLDLVPAFTSVTVHYDPARVGGRGGLLPHVRLTRAVGAALEGLEAAPSTRSRTVEIPVCYGGEFGPDLQDVARYHSLSPGDVVRLHSERDYLVYMIGFAPGFPYLGGLDERLATPRLDAPRTRVPAGSVGIGGSQTGVYPFESPGGWRLIGRTPLRLFDPAREPAALLRTGDQVRFRPIAESEYLELLSP